MVCLSLVTCRSVCREIGFGNIVPTQIIISGTEKALKGPVAKSSGCVSALFSLRSTQLSKQFQAHNIEQFDTNTQLADDFQADSNRSTDQRGNMILSK